jgi:hypothetical protein
MPLHAAAISYATDFDAFSTVNPYTHSHNPNADEGGSVNGQDGWTANVDVGGIDEQIVDLGGGDKALRLSNYSTHGNYGTTHPNPPPIEAAGESVTGASYRHFSFSYDFKSATGALQDGLEVNTTAWKSGTAQRHALVKITDSSADGLSVGYWDYTGTGGGFRYTDIATGLSRTEWHHVEVDLIFLEGESNDVVRITVDGSVVEGLTTWEGYYKDYSPSEPEHSTVDSVIFRVAGTAVPALLGDGLYFDNFSMEVVNPDTVYVDDDWAGTTPGDDPDGGGPATGFGFDAFATIQEGIDAVAAGGTVNVAAGTYDESVTIDKSVTLSSDTGDYVTSGTVVSGALAWSVNASDVTIQGFRFENISATANGVVTGDGDNLALSSNSFVNVDTKAVLCYTPGVQSGWTITGNYISGVTGLNESALFLDGLANSTIAHNEIENTAYGGMILSNVEGIHLHNNVIRNTPRKGIQISGTPLNPAETIVEYNTIDNTVTSDDYDEGAISLYADVENVTIQYNDLINNYRGLVVRHLELGSVPDSIHVHYNNIYNNRAASGLVDDPADYQGGKLNAQHNWWGDASGPLDDSDDTASGGLYNPGGLGDPVTDYVDYDPWLNAEVGVLQGLIDAAPSGGTLYLDPIYYVGGAVVDKALTIVGQEGTVVGYGSPAYTIASDGVSIKGQEIDGTGDPDGSSGIVVNDGVSYVWLEDLDIHDWPADGVHFNGAVTHLKAIDNLVYANGEDGMEFAGALSGSVDIYGNAFRNNGGLGIGAVSGPVPATYNAWNHVDGPSSGDGVDVDVTYDPFTFGSLAVVPANETVLEGAGATVEVQMDVANLYGVQFDLSFDPTVLQLDGTTIGTFETGSMGTFCMVTDPGTANTSGTVTFYCNRAGSDDEYSAQDDPVLTLNFTALDVAASTNSALTLGNVVLGAKGGINIPVNAVTDGNVNVLSLTELSGKVDLQGRGDESGASVDLLAGAAHAYDPAAAVTNNWGNYTIADVTDDTYVVTVSMPRYLDVIEALGKSVTVSGGAQAMPDLTLLGGDANGDSAIDTSDAAVIGGQYGNSGGSITDARADINADDSVDILDLTLMGGNYNYSTDPVKFASGYYEAYTTWLP